MSSGSSGLRSGWSGVGIAMGLALWSAGCPQPDGGEGESKPTEPLAKAELLASLPDYCNTPDGMALMPDGSFILSVPNFNDEEQPPLLVKVTKENEVEKFHELPTPYPGLPAGIDRLGPMGITYSPTGCLFLADMQLDPMEQNSRLWRLDLEDGKVQRMVLVASGFNVANGLAVEDGYVYITESVLKPSGDPAPGEGESAPERFTDPYTSAVMRFRVDEENVTLTTPLEDDPHIIATFESYKTAWPFGADGIAFDSEGNLFVGVFGDGIMYKLTLGADGEVTSNEEFARADFLINCDGMSCDRRTDKLYVADSAANAIRIINPDGSIETLAVNGDVQDKTTGLLDQPCEAMVRGDTVVSSNMDWAFPGMVNSGHQRPATLSVIELK